MKGIFDLVGARSRSVHSLLMEIKMVGFTSEKFVLGRILVTLGVVDSIESLEILGFLKRHHLSDWGDICEEDLSANEMILKEKCRLNSAYN